MAEDLRTNIRIGLNSTDVTGSVSEINRQLRVLDSEFKRSAEETRTFGNTTEELRTRQEILNKQIELQTAKITRLRESYERSRTENGENARATANLAIRYNQAEVALTRMQSELRQTTESIQQQTVRTNVFSNTLNNLNARIEESTNKYEALSSKMKSVATGLTIGVTAPLMAIGAACTKLAIDAVESENLFEVSMGKLAGAAREWSVKLADSLGLNEYTVRKNVATFNTMLLSMGLTENKAFDMSKSMTQLAYDMASFYNLKPEVAFEKLRSGISGETEPLKALGILVNETTAKAYALKNGIGGVSGELTEQEKVLARYGVIMLSLVVNV